MGSTPADPGNSTNTRIAVVPSRHIAEAAARPRPPELDRSTDRMGSTGSMDNSTGTPGTRATTAPRLLSLRKRKQNFRGDRDVPSRQKNVPPSRQKDDLPNRQREAVLPKCQTRVVLPKCQREAVPPKCQTEAVLPKCQTRVVLPKCQREA